MLKLAQAYGLRSDEIGQSSTMCETIDRVLAGDDPVICVVHLGENEFAPKLASRMRPDGTFASSSLEDLAPFLPEDVVRDNLVAD